MRDTHAVSASAATAFAAEASLTTLTPGTRAQGSRSVVVSCAADAAQSTDPAALSEAPVSALSTLPGCDGHQIERHRSVEEGESDTSSACGSAEPT